METYQNLCTEFYDLDKPHAPTDAMNFYSDYVRKAQGPILEPMCGSGRFLIPLLEQGFPIEGLDASLPMLKACMRKCVARRVEPVLYSQFLQEMSLEKQFALIFIPSGSLGLITDVFQLKSCLKNFYDHLLPNGKLVFEIDTVHSVPKHLNIWHGAMHTKNDGSKILLSKLPIYDAATQVLQSINRYESIQDNQVIHTELEDLRVRLYKHEELDNWLEDEGFKDIRHLKAYGLSEPDGSDKTIVYECAKT